MNENQETQLAVQEQPIKRPIVATDRGVQLASLSQMQKFAEVAVNSGIYGRDMTPAVAIIKIQAGMELGLSPVWSLTNIMVVNARPSVWGDALLGIVLNNPQCEDVIETSEGGELYDKAGKINDSYSAVCEVRRKGRLPVIRKFSVADARRAGILGKNVHGAYQGRMLQMRARSWACRDAFADALRGLGVREEMETASAEPKQVQGRVVAQGLVLPDETPSEPDQKTEESTQEASAKIEPSDNDGASQDWTKGPDLF